MASPLLNLDRTVVKSGFTIEGRFINDGQNQILGNEKGFYSKNYLLFENLQIPRGSTILNSDLSLTLEGFEGETVNTNIMAIKNTTDITYRVLVDNQKQIYSKVAWQNLPKGLTGTKIKSPNLSNILQEIVNKSDWESGDSIVIFLNGEASSLNSYIKFYSGQKQEKLNPVLNIKYISTFPEQKTAPATAVEGISASSAPTVPPTPVQSPSPTPTLKSNVIKIVLDESLSDSTLQGEVFENKGMTQSFGRGILGNFKNLLLFKNIRIPKNSTIKNVLLTLTITGGSGKNVNSKIYAVKTSNPTAPIDNEDFISKIRALTFENIIWNDIPSGNWGTTAISPDLSRVFQEIVDQSDWSEGNSIMLYFEDYLSEKYSDRSFLTSDFSGTDPKPTLVIEFETPQVFQTEDIVPQEIATETQFPKIDLSLILEPVLKEN